MIDLYTYATPNGRKPAIMLEEVGLPYRLRWIDFERGQKTPAFLALNPNGKIPVVVDAGRTIVESGAILLYLAEKSGRLVPDDPIATLEWMLFQAAHVGPMMGQLGHFHRASERVPYAIERYSTEVRRLFRVLDGRLADRDYLVGGYGLADIMTWPWIDAAGALDMSLEPYPSLARWHAAIGARPAVRRGLDTLAKAKDEHR